MNLDILYIDGINPLSVETSYIGYLFSTASVLEQYGYKYKILNIGTLREFSIDCLIDELRLIHFKSIGMTTNATNIKYVYKICENIKKTFPNTPIILGGPEVTYSDIETLQKCQCDIIIRKEGEYKTIEILDYLCGIKSKIEKIKGITYKDKNGNIIRNEDCNDFDINNLPIPKYEILTNKKYWIIPHDCEKKRFESFLTKITKPEKSYILTGMGCPYRCSFCVEGISEHKKTYYLAPNKVRDNLEHYLKVTNVKYLGIADDTFTSSPKRVNEICEVFNSVRKKYDFHWFAEGRVDVLSRNLELIKLMYDAGLRRLQIGIESGNQKVLNAYNKLITIEQIMTVLNEVSKLPKLEVVGNIIIGNPFETKEEFRAGILNLKKMFVSSGYKLRISSSFLTPYHGTPIRLFPEKYGIEFTVKDFEFTETPCMDGITCKPKHLTIDDLMELKLFFEQSVIRWENESMFCLSKSELDKRIQNSITIDNPFNNTFGKLFSFKRYIAQIRNNTTIYSTDITEGDLYDVYPTRLWQIEKINGKYEFLTISGSKIEMDGYKAILWEMANGNNSVRMTFDVINKELFVSVKQIMDFYTLLEQNFALVFRKYDCK